MTTMNDEILDRYLEGNVSTKEAEEFMAWLRDPANLERLARRAELHAELRCSLLRRHIQTHAIDKSLALDECNLPVEPTELDKVHGETAGPELLIEPEHPNEASPLFGSRQAIWWTVALATAACLLIVSIMSTKTRNTAAPKQHVAAIVSEINASLVGFATNGDAQGLSAGEHELRRGLIHLRFDGGVMVYLEAPARFNAVSGKRLVLHSGRASASVPPEGVGFTVETPEAEVIDFGTEFSVEVEPGASEVHVFDGLVRVKPRSMKAGDSVSSVDLRTSQAIKIDDPSKPPVGIKLAKERFIRNFEEPKRKYAQSIKQLNPIAYYRMPIRDRGLVAEPAQYSGVVLTGEGRRPEHAHGVFTGGSLRVQADSTGRGGRVDAPIRMVSGQFALTVFVYRETAAPGGIIATDIRGDEGRFELSLDGNGLMQARLRNDNGSLRKATCDAALPLKTWCHLVVTADGEQLRIYQDGRPVAATRCGTMRRTDAGPTWFGTANDGTRLWDGRIDELALFDKSISDQEIANLYQAGLDEVARTE